MLQAKSSVLFFFVLIAAPIARNEDSALQRDGNKGV
jgi:hypothetical protein